MTTNQNGGKTRLESWKEIANHLNVSVRTAQKWEAERCLPVQRYGGFDRPKVAAFAEDLDRWRESPPAQNPDESPNRTIVFAALGLTGVVALAVVLWVVWPRVPEPARCDVHAGGFSVFDKGSKLLWTVSEPELSVVELQPDSPVQRSLVADLDGDGGSEVLMNLLTVPSAPLKSRLACFEGEGRLRWEFHPGAEVRVDQRRISRDYRIRQIAVVRAGPHRFVVVASSHRYWCPAQVALLDPANGRLIAEYWHPGWFFSLISSHPDQGDSDTVFAGGTANPGTAIGDPVVIRLEPSKALAAARAARGSQAVAWPETGYCVFPKPDVCLLPAVAFLFVDRLRQTNGLLEVQLSAANTSFLYYFDRTLRLVEFRPGPRISEQHGWGFRTKVLDHPLTDKEVASWGKVKLYPSRPLGVEVARLGRD